MPEESKIVRIGCVLIEKSYSAADFPEMVELKPYVVLSERVVVLAP